MIYTRTSIDYDTLPAAMLPELKAWARVDHTDDDAILLSQLAMAISHLEKISDLSIFAAEITATPTPLDRARYLPPYLRPNVHPLTWPNLVALPHFPVAEIEVQFGDGSTAPYTGTVLVGDPDYGPTFVEYPSEPDGGRYAYVAGFASLAEVPPLVRRYVYRLASSLYENREAAVDIVAESFADEFLPLWRPST